MVSRDTFVLALTAQYSALVAGLVIRRVGLRALYTWHPVLQAASLLLSVWGVLKAQATHTGSPKPSATRKAGLTTVHGYFQAGGAVCLVAGNVMMYLTKEEVGWGGLPSCLCVYVP